jgi:N-carbamoyl-L-amino-acid hydrolase
MRINGERLRQSLADLAQIGATPGGGVTRLALSDEDWAGRDLLRGWMDAAGLAVRIDDFGDMIGRRAGAQSGPPLQLASHIDSVRCGGRFDGPLGVLAALEVVNTLNDHSVTTQMPLEVINWTNEEGVRFEPAMLCSGGASGRFSQEYVYSRTDRDGRRFEDELRRIGYLGDIANRPEPGAAYLELHIEQGPNLEALGARVGVVEGIVGVTWCDVTIDGQAAHAGGSPMHLRHDALVAAAELVSGVDRIARAAGAPTVGTVGRLFVEPNVINTIPGRIVMSADFRHSSGDTLDRLVTEFEQLAASVATARNVEVTVNRFWTSEPTSFAPKPLAAIQSAMEELSLPMHRLWSGAGHDAKYAADRGPAGMIFIRSQNGLSHCEVEFSTPEDIEAGANVLLLAESCEKAETFSRR